MKELILKELKRIERERGIRILYANESGSRAWGFASPDSDYDVRFIYAHPRDWYLGIQSHTDTIDLPIDENDLDFSGWDVRKALGLFYKSNSGLIEWMHSPLVYREDAEFMARWRGLMPDFFDVITSASHYLGHCKSFWIKSLEGATEVTGKKYLYTLRTLLAARWILRKGENPPVEFSKLYGDLEEGSEVRSEIEKLVAAKEHINESDTVPCNDVLHAFIAEQRLLLEAEVAELEPVRRKTDALDAFFRDTIRE